MTRGCALVAAALAMSGCVHRQMGDERPGHVVLEQPPAALAARGTLPAEPMPAPAVVVSAGAMLDWGARCNASCAGEGTLGFELGVYFTRVRRGQTFRGLIGMTLAGSPGSWA